MSTLIKDTMEKHFSNVKFDKELDKKVVSFLRRFISKNDDHVSFFGGNLLGVDKVRWNYSDSDEWWDDIWNVMEGPLQKDLYKVPDIKPNRFISSDAMNHAYIYSLYKIHHSTYLNDKEKEALKIKVMMTLNIKFLTSILSHFFKFPADRGTAEKTYNSLTMRFDIKALGTWGAMLEKRSADLVSPKGRYYRAYTTYDDDIEIIKFINDVQCRIKDTVKELTAVYYKMLGEGSKVLSSSSTMELDGVKLVKDINRARNTYVRYLRDTVSMYDGYDKELITDIVYSAVPSLTPDKFDEIQEGFLTLYKGAKHRKLLDEMMENVLIFSFDVIQEKKLVINDITAVTYILKHIFMSGRITDPTLLKAREQFAKMTQYIDKSFKREPLVPERCAFFLYLVLRTVTMKHFG